jgi:hypothetical protein
VIALDVLRKELDERVGVARAAGEQVDGNLKETLQQVWASSRLIQCTTADISTLALTAHCPVIRS